MRRQCVREHTPPRPQPVSERKREGIKGQIRTQGTRLALKGKWKKLREELQGGGLLGGTSSQGGDNYSSHLGNIPLVNSFPKE